MKPRKKYTLEFKQEAVQLAERIGVAKTAKELGLSYDNVNRWRKMGDLNSEKNNSTNASRAALEKELNKLRRENGYLKKINEVLKKSTAIFSNEHMGGLK